MYAYYRTSCHGTVNQKILRGSFSSNDSSDLVLVKVKFKKKKTQNTVLTFVF